MRRRTFLASLPALTGGAALTTPAYLDAKSGSCAFPSLTQRDVRAGDRPIGAIFASRSAAFGMNGAAACAHPLANVVGLDILRQGGSAVDAAIAMNACLGFLEPVSCGIGGDLYALLWDPGQKEVIGLESSGRSPKALTFETARSRTKQGVLPLFGAVTVSVPGAVAGWWALHERYGKLRWSDLLQPAIELAENGVPLAPVIAAALQIAMGIYAKANTIEEFGNAQRTFAPDGNLPGPGDPFRNPDLARSYRLIAAGGRDAFYDGAIAETIESYFRRIGGWLNRADLAAHTASWSVPLRTTYREAEVYAIGANTQGLATLQMLNILEQFDLRDAGFQSALSIHLQVEAKRLAFEDRARFYGDPDFAKVPFEWLGSKDYAAERARLIRPDRMMEDATPGRAPSRGDTTYLTVADSEGLMVSLIQSNYWLMGSGLVPDGLGFMLQNRGQLFSFVPGHQNLYAPAKRPFQTIIPGFATRGGKPWFGFGVMGGDMQPQGQTQIIVNRIDYELDVQAVGDAPRWHHGGSSETMGEDGGKEGPAGILHLESGVPTESRLALAKLGWTIEDGYPIFGRYHGIEVARHGSSRVYGAGSDMRADGIALAY